MYKNPTLVKNMKNVKWDAIPPLRGPDPRGLIKDKKHIFDLCSVSRCWRGETMNSQIGDGCDSEQGVSRSLSVEHHNCHLRLYNNNINFYPATHHHPLK